MDINFNTVKKLFEKNGYHANDKLIWQTIINLQKAKSGIASGQDIHSICLEGPPGSGKTFYAETYYKVLAEVLGEDVELVQYQCNSTTGKRELYEDIRVAAAISGDGENVLIPGKVAEAIEKVINGKRVVLFLDEYDKAREETDSFLLDFLQEGRINTTQKGELEIPQEYMQNLQVILCKNDVREELSGPLSRRLKTIKLDYMEPETFKKVAEKVLKNSDANIREAVCTFYYMLYNSRDNYKRIPACSELLMAIQDADILLKNDVDEKYIYAAIVSNMLKTKDDIETFKSVISRNPSFSGMADKILAEDRTPEIGGEDFRKMAFETFFSNDVLEIAKLIEYKKELTKKLEEISESKANIKREVSQYKGRIENVANVREVRTKYEDLCEDAKRAKTSKSVDLSKWREFIGDKRCFSAISDGVMEIMTFSAADDIVLNINEIDMEELLQAGGYYVDGALVLKSSEGKITYIDTSDSKEYSLKSNDVTTQEDLENLLQQLYKLGNESAIYVKSMSDRVTDMLR